MFSKAYKVLSEGGMGLVHGHPGYGKTWAACEACVKDDGVLIVARPGWTQKALLKALVRELGGEPKGTNADMLDQAIQIVWHLRDCDRQQRPIFVDEADYLFHDVRALETLRCIFDETGNPVIVVGMSGVPNTTGIEKRIKRYPQFADRIGQWVQFTPADFSDARLMAKAFCQVEVADDLLQKLLDVSQGNLRQMRQGLARIQYQARISGRSDMALAHWGDKPFALRGVA
jgi:DNA transposition AAA+ family ATPase